MNRALPLLIALVAACAVAVTGARANGSPYSPGLAGWDGVVAPDGETRFATVSAETHTVVVATRVRGGRIVNSRSLRGYYGIPLVAYDGTTGGVSGDGKTLVVGSYGPMPGDKGTTRFAVLGTRTLRPRQEIVLRGTWSYDAISPDGAILYLIEHISAGQNPRYRVRALDVASGRLFSRPIVDTRENERLMRGQPATRAMGPAGRWAYTLYARQQAQPFVHALDTATKKALCIDVPLKLSRDEQMLLRLTLRAGRMLHVRRGGKTVAAVDTKTYEVQRH